MDSNNVIEVKSVSKSYGGITALDNVTLSVSRGEFVSLLGPSGSGKTTLLKILSGFEMPTAGQIMFDGKDITALKPESRNFGIVFQRYALFPHMSVMQNIAYSLKVRRWNRAAIRDRVNEILDLVQLGKLAARRPHELSGGQQQRVALARALAFKPELLLLDEPLSALDKRLRIDLQAELRRIHGLLGTTFIYVTHDQEEAMGMSDRIAVINGGALEQYNTPFNLYRRPKSQFVAGFLGNSNIFSGKVERDGAGLFFEMSGDRERILLATQEGDIGHSSGLMVRPEDVSIARSKLSDHVSLPAQVADATYLGDRIVYTLHSPTHGNLTASARAQTNNPLAIGDSVWVSFKPEDSVLIG